MKDPANVETTKAVVIYDGECPFCRRQVSNIQRLDSRHQLEYIARQSPDTELRFPQVRQFDLEEGLLLVDSSGEVYVAADAFYRIGKRLPSLKSIVWIYQIPGLKQIIQLGYRLIAANRRKLGKICSDESCKL